MILFQLLLTLGIKKTTFDLQSYVISDMLLNSVCPKLNLVGRY